MIFNSSCPVCDSSEISNLKGYEIANLVKCNSCAFVFSKQIPSELQLDKHYEDNYELTRYFSPITKIRYNKLLDEFEKYRSTNKILDVGCGCGFFLKTAKERGWEVYGVEKTKELNAKLESEGVTMFAGNFSDCTFEANSFDVIVSIEVIEHVTKPRLFVKKGSNLLRTGGLFYITTPNFNSYLRYRLKNEYDVIDYPSHLQYFTRKTLNHLFESNHFKKISLISSGVSITRFRTSKKLSNQDFVSETSDDEMLRYRAENAPLLKVAKWSTNQILNLLKLGITLKGSFVKS